MRHTRRRLALGLGVALAVSSPAWSSGTKAQADLPKTLVGTWEGDLQTLGVGNRDDPHRTLKIVAITQQRGRWTGSGRFGITGKGLGPVEIELDTSGTHPWLRFVTAVNATVRVELVDDTHLVGTFSHREVGGTLGSDRAIKLEKKE